MEYAVWSEEHLHTTGIRVGALEVTAQEAARYARRFNDRWGGGHYRWGSTDELRALVGRKKATAAMAKYAELLAEVDAETTQKTAVAIARWLGPA
jgi:hypothetical protein